MERQHKLTSLRTGRLYTLSAREIQDFYDHEILGQASKPRLFDRLSAIVREVAGLPKNIQIKSELRAVGTVLLQLFGPQGDLLDVRAGGNLVVTTGKNAVIDRLQGTSVGVHDYQAVGTGTTAAAAGDTALETEIGTRVQGTLSQPAATTDRLVSTFAAANGTGALTETGRLTASSGGNLFARQVFSVVNKGASDALTTTHDVTIS